MRGEAVTLEPKDLARIRGCPLFTGMEEAEVLSALAAEGVHRVRFRRGEVIYRPHEFSRKLGILLSGSVAVTKGDFPVSRLRPGDLFGAAALYNEEPDYVTTLNVLSDCAVLFLSQDWLEGQMDRRAGLRRNYIRYLSGRIRFLSGKLEELTGPTAEAKLFHYLAQRAHQGAVELDCSMTELAKRLGMGRASLYRALDALEGEGTIKRTGKTVFLTVPEKG